METSHQQFEHYKNLLQQSKAFHRQPEPEERRPLTKVDLKGEWHSEDMREEEKDTVQEPNLNSQRVRPPLPALRRIQDQLNDSHLIPKKIVPLSEAEQNSYISQALPERHTRLGLEQSLLQFKRQREESPANRYAKLQAAQTSFGSRNNISHHVRGDSKSTSRSPVREGSMERQRTIGQFSGSSNIGLIKEVSGEGMYRDRSRDPARETGGFRQKDFSGDSFPAKLSTVEKQNDTRISFQPPPQEDSESDMELPDQEITLHGESFFKDREEERKKTLKELVLGRIEKDDKREAFVCFRYFVQQQQKYEMRERRAVEFADRWMKDRAFTAFCACLDRKKRAVKAEKMAARLDMKMKGKVFKRIQRVLAAEKKWLSNVQKELANYKREEVFEDWKKFVKLQKFERKNQISQRRKVLSVLKENKDQEKEKFFETKERYEVAQK